MRWNTVITRVLCVCCLSLLFACGQKTSDTQKSVDLSGQGPTREELLQETLPVIAVLRLVSDPDAVTIVGSDYTLVVQLFSKDEEGIVRVLAEKTFRWEAIPFPAKVQFDVPMDSVNPNYSYFVTAYMTDYKDTVWENSEHAGVITQGNKLTTYIQLQSKPIKQ